MKRGRSREAKERARQTGGEVDEAGRWRSGRGRQVEKWARQAGREVGEARAFYKSRAKGDDPKRRAVS